MKTDEESLLFIGTTQLAADKPELLRSLDVDRVMSDVPFPLSERYRAWLLSADLQPDTRAAVVAWNWYR